MEHCKLPIELCEAIMDVIPSSRRFLSPNEYHTLVACRDVCSVWSIHAKAILNRSTVLDSPHVVSLFVSAVRRESPDRVDFLELLDLNWSEFQGNRDLSRCVDLFMTPLPNVQALHLAGVRFDLGPRLLRMRLPFFTRISSLVLIFSQFYSHRAMLDIIWACPNLKDVAIRGCSFGGSPLTPESAARLSAARRHLRGCQQLIDLFIHINEEWCLLPGDAFGSTLTRLEIHCEGHMTRHITRLLQCGFPQLQELNIVVYNNDPRREIAHRLPSLLLTLATSVPSYSALSTILISLHAPFDGSGGEGGDVSALCEWIIGRSDEWKGVPLRSLLAGLHRLWIHLFGVGRRVDGQACAKFIVSVLPVLHDILRVSIGTGWRVVYPDTDNSSAGDYLRTTKLPG
ncbi:hypothetical protein C8Q79DRAFT_246482 [Trametes meyenii]|nr:hypothetical protein C8Q79DRAFT_246482 [Trametes meyenii]